MTGTAGSNAIRVRRVVTGHDANGRAVVVSDEVVEPVTFAQVPGPEYHLLWSAAQPPTFPDDGTTTPLGPYFPTVGGFRFTLTRIEPEGAPPPENLDVEALYREVDERLPGLRETMDDDDPGMHRSATVDLGMVLSGAVTLELDDGAEVDLHTGDVYVQNGTRHRWHNRSTEPCYLALVLIGAHDGTAGAARQ